MVYNSTIARLFTSYNVSFYRYDNLRDFGKLFLTGKRTFLPLLFKKISIPDVIQWKYRTDITKGSYGRIYTALCYDNSIQLFRVDRKEVSMFIGRGIIAEPDFSTIHFLITYNKYTTCSTLEHFRLYLSPEFIEPKGKFRLLYKKFSDDFIQEAITQGLDVVITNNILNLYTDEVEQPEVLSFEDELNRLKDIPKLLMDG